ncbi:MAG: response regulator [Candidatus Omnitrophica bacterium]|nr:response regulator [Candidatus Omnitrophota bacterium]
MKKILVVDDEVDIVEVLKLRLEANSYSVSVALDGAIGLEKAKSEKPDLILLDIAMPKLDGYNFVKEIKADEATRGMPIIILTAKDKMKDLFEIEGIKDYIVKPFDPEKLIARVEKVLIGE